jgi:hypothetical protein
MPGPGRSESRVAIVAILAIMIVTLACIAACAVTTTAFLMNPPWQPLYR